jgi:hypothetical protein
MGHFSFLLIPCQFLSKNVTTNSSHLNSTDANIHLIYYFCGLLFIRDYFLNFKCEYMRAHKYKPTLRMLSSL